MCSESAHTSRIMRAKRLKIIRTITGLSRDAFAKKYRFPASNFQNWEGPRFGGLTEQGAAKMIEGCKQEGLEVTMEWLMYGVGPEPYVNSQYYCGKSQKFIQKKLASLQSSLLVNPSGSALSCELALFQQNCGKQGMLSMVVADDSMEPCYKRGEHVAGPKVACENLVKLSGMDCLVELEDGSLVLKRVTAGSNSKVVTLHCKKSVVSDVSIKHIAPVLWIRRMLRVF